MLSNEYWLTYCLFSNIYFLLVNLSSHYFPHWYWRQLEIVFVQCDSDQTIITTSHIYIMIVVAYLSICLSVCLFLNSRRINFIFGGDMQYIPELHLICIAWPFCKCQGYHDDKDHTFHYIQLDFVFNTIHTL